MGLWKLIDRALENPPSRLNLDEDTCYYALNYLSEGWSISPENQKIINLKIPPTEKSNSYRWKYKLSAVQEFARNVAELDELFKEPLDYSFVAMPGSRSKSDAAYDNRLDLVLSELQKITHVVLNIECPIEAINTVPSVHAGGGVRNPSFIQSNYRWCGFKNSAVNNIVLIDDVITSGSHFKAYKNFLSAHSPQTKVTGLFWALTNQ